ncbi:MAG: BCAM0308 family protein [Candidatus Loosdrechtia sp.]|uniref:BCAM0308 family protein n=1 Tax=Candidatus Loosdrechtia sp. TaxID=3101272 RepID=UPI003A71DAF0|nr:MAG: BCAM0308 family protein [Candidatus Jettenia sp. AMX2]
MSPRKKTSSFNKHIRDRLKNENDPYLPPKGSGLPEVSICQDCTAVYHKKKWFLDSKLYKEKKKLKDVHWITCPACKRIKERVPGGVITLKGDFLKQHKQEIMNLIHNEDEHSKKYNPLKRIMKIDDRGNEVEIQTTTGRLALRLGTILFRAYDGEVEYKKHENWKSMRVEWRR